MDNRKLVYIVIGLVVYIVSTVGSYLFFISGKTSTATQALTSSTPSGGVKKTPYQALAFDTSAPKTQPCPLNGVMYSKDQEAWWLKHRPLGVMIENSTDARPQSGISFADVTYEAVAEGGITRTMNVYYCQDAGFVGPVRSARTYFLDYISEYGSSPLYAHVGGANTPGPADAIGQIDDYGWTGRNDLNQFSIGYPVYKRDEMHNGHDVATEHTMYSTTSLLWDYAKANRNLTNVDKNGDSWDTSFVKYTFKDDSAATTPTASSVTVPFWQDADYEVVWKYDKSTNAYLRVNGGQAHIDHNTMKQLSAKDVIVLFETQRSANDGYENNLHNLYGTIGSGKAAVFMDGKEIDGTWKKATRTSRTLLYAAMGSEIQFNKGHMWFEIVPTTETLTVK